MMMELEVIYLQTDKCIDATIKCRFEHGFHMIVPAYINSTINNKYLSGKDSYKYYNEFIWNGDMPNALRLMKL